MTIMSTVFGATVAAIGFLIAAGGAIIVFEGHGWQIDLGGFAAALVGVTLMRLGFAGMSL